MSAIAAEIEIEPDVEKQDALGNNSPLAVELPRGKPWRMLTRQQRQNRLDTLDPGPKPGGIRDRLMRGLARGGDE